VAGVDEAGRGPLAGPVVVSAVVMDPDRAPRGLADSKLLSPEDREYLYEKILDRAQAVSLGIASARMIDRLNILEATRWAMARAIDRLEEPLDCVLVDGNSVPDVDLPAAAVVGGDGMIRSVAAASIVAKVTRDRLMKRMDSLFPRYFFKYNKGYGTPEHLRALRAHGPTRIHRFSFEPVARSLGRTV
jgi:ribonuclease HII